MAVRDVLLTAEAAEREVFSLHRGELVDDSRNAAFIGGPAITKIHVATAIGFGANVHQRLPVFFFLTIEPINALE